MRIVLDTNVLLSSTLWDGSVAQKLLFKLIKGGVKIFASENILSEYKKVLERDFEYSGEKILSVLEKITLFLNCFPLQGLLWRFALFNATAKKCPLIWQDF